MRSLVIAIAALYGCTPARAQPITSAQLENAGSDVSSWLSYGRDPFGQRSRARRSA